VLVTSCLVSTILDPCILAVHDGADCRSGGGNVSVPRVGEISLARRPTHCRVTGHLHPPLEKTTRRTRPIMCRALGFRVAI